MKEYGGLTYKMERKIKYEEPGMSVIVFTAQDVITSSQLIDGGTGSGGSGSWEDFLNSDL